MSLEFNTSGLSIQTYQEIYDEIVAAYQAIYGADINVDADSPDGQRIGIEAKARLDIQSFCLSLYSQLDPDLAEGTMLNMLIKYAGLSRRAPTRSQVDVTITTDRNLTLPAGYAVEDTLGQIWITDSEIPTTGGANSVTLFSEEFGSIEAATGTVTIPSMIIIGVISVTNATPATVGVNEETDPELRLRRNRSLQNPATSTVGGLFSVLGNLSGVTDLIVYENDQDVVDVALSINPHTIWCVVEGGAVSDIIEALAKNKTAGTGIKGAVSGTYVETVIRPDQTEFTIDHEMLFDRPVPASLYVNLTVQGATPTTVVNTDAIKQAIAARTFTIAQGLSATDLYAEVYSAGAGFTATLLQISDDDTTFVSGRLDPAPDGKFTVDIADIEITDIT